MKNSLITALNEASRGLEENVKKFSPSLEKQEVGHIRFVGQGIARIEGLSRVKAEELVVLGKGVMGLVLDILPDRVGVVILETGKDLRAGDEVTRTGRIRCPRGRNAYWTGRGPPGPSPGHPGADQ